MFPLAIASPPVSYTHLDVYKRQQLDGRRVWLDVMVSFYHSVDHREHRMRPTI